MGVKAKRKVSPNPTPGWTAPTTSSQEPLIPSFGYLTNLALIAAAVHAANEEYLAVVSEYLRWRDRSASNNSSYSNHRFNSEDLEKLRAVIQARPPEENTLSTSQILEALEDTSYVDIWKRAAENMAFLKRHPKHQNGKHQGKAMMRAKKLRDCRVSIESSFWPVEKDLRASHLDNTCASILAKIEMLREYEEAYPIASDRPRYYSFNNRSPNLLFFISIYAMATLVLMGVAFKLSTNTRGSTGSSDFYVQIVNAMPQTLGLFTTVFTIRKKSAEYPRAWTSALCLTVIGMALTWGAIPIYVQLPTIWSGLLSICGSFAALANILQLSVITETSKLKQL
ncbi:uncharacterized protein F4822DRAFT_205394 [Hypoxylon trugodes]|uniref:uncharacterized protein n=1 Tax=Hypoxylon trugodes TaxID=326681 RepID=UPI002192A88F|nr:uncharacterized protein F4822DRAFT_205394 [Hypoxylon trugodes]KAI1389578.1 hypothetical protein F4822DRAFT_205394 [Hypoxylon trugodes]